MLSGCCSQARIRLAVAAEEYQLAAECKDRVAELVRAISALDTAKADKAPPPNESPLQRRKRLQQEAAAAPAEEWCDSAEFADELDIE